jgi:AAA domain
MSSPVEVMLGRLERVHQNGEGWTARCPAHDDHEPSLMIDERDGRVLLHCHAGCSPEAVVGAMGLTMADLFARRNRGSPRSPGITLAELARSKGLPAAWLAQTLGWYDLPSGGVGLPYRDETGKTRHVKRRMAMQAKDGSYWPKGIPLMAYGLEALAAAREAGYLLLVEGETDTATLRYHGLPVLGIPGADSIKVLQAEHLQALSTVYAWQEPDKAGATFVQRLAGRLARLGYQGQAKVIRLEGVKDASDLHVRNPEGFKAAMQQAMAVAQDLRREEPKPGLILTRLGDLLAEPEETVEWLVDDLLPSGGFSLLAAKPKVGKSTLARCLALAVARGESFLGRATAKGPVIDLALEEKRSQVRQHFQAMGATGEEEIYVYAATAPADALEKIRAVVEEKKPALLIIDPLFRFTRVRDGNDYAQVTQALEPLLALARETGVHVLVVHHLGKGERTGGDAILGSTAILGAVDTSVILKRTERYRTITSEQRYGDDLEETTLRFDPQTRTTTLGETKEAEEEVRIGEGILAYLEAKSEPAREAEIDSDVEGKTRIRRKALRDLLAAGKILRSGKGGKSDPFRYRLSDALANQAGNNNQTDASPANTESHSGMGVVVPLFPHIYREQENMNRQTDLSTQVYEPYSCSRDFSKDADGTRASPYAGNTNRSSIQRPCAGCRDSFTPGQDGATGTLCGGCAADARRRDTDERA